MTIDHAAIKEMALRDSPEINRRKAVSHICPNPATDATAKETDARIGRVDGDFVLDAALIGELFDLPAADVAPLMRSKHITSICETGIDADQGTFRLNLFYRGRHARLRIDATGRILRRSVIDFGEMRLRKNSAAGAFR